MVWTYPLAPMGSWGGRAGKKSAAPWYSWAPSLGTWPSFAPWHPVASWAGIPFPLLLHLHLHLSWDHSSVPRSVRAIMADLSTAWKNVVDLV